MAAGGLSPSAFRRNSSPTSTARFRIATAGSLRCTPSARQARGSRRWRRGSRVPPATSRRRQVAGEPAAKLAALQKSLSSHRAISIRADHEMIDQLELYELKRLLHASCERQILRGRGGIAGWVVVKENDADGIRLERVTDHVARGDEGARDGCHVELA